jgi:SAM-dependent methyltransferase
MDWRIKGVVQSALSAVPYGVRVNDWLQQSLGNLRDFSGAVDTRVGDWFVLVENMRELQVDVQGIRLLEVGTGWMPILPICFSLGGASSCVTVDLNRHMNAKLTFRMLPVLERYLPRIASATKQPLDKVESEYRALAGTSSLAALLERARITYLSPADARATALQPESVDVVFSNNVFEHIPGEVLLDIFRESQRILRKGGLAIHSVNCADHYAYFDRNISLINYLAYSDEEWRFWNSKLQYQNRLRPQDFVELATEAGLDVPLRKLRTRDELRPALARMKVAPQFQKYDAVQLCSTSITMGCVRRA